MNRNFVIGLGALAAVVLVFMLSALFTVHQTQQALVLQFGNPKRVVTEPGLHFKLPFVQNAVYIDRRVLDFDAAVRDPSNPNLIFGPFNCDGIHPTPRGYFEMGRMLPLDLFTR